MTTNLQNSDAIKIQLTMAIMFISQKNTEEERVTYLNSDNIKFTSYSEVNAVVNELLMSLTSKYQENLETSMKGSGFIFDSVQITHCKCHKVNSKWGGLYADCPNWIYK